MNGIYYKDGIYVLIDDDEAENDICIYNYHKRDILLYGGRIAITYANNLEAFFEVDGIPIVNLSGNSNVDYGKTLSGIISYLNAIEANGVDAFLENYRKSVEFIYGELKEIYQKTESLLVNEQEDTKTNNILAQLSKIKDLFLTFLSILFNLNTYMSSGLENEKVISASQSIMDLLL